MISILKILKLVVNYNIKSKFWKKRHLKISIKNNFINVKNIEQLLFKKYTML